MNETMDDETKVSYEAPSKRRRPSPPPDLPQPPSKPATLSTTSPSTAMAPSRAGTLSWQQRPTSRGSTGQRARPLSQFAAENNAARSPRASVEPPCTTEREISKDEIAESLGSKDPTWFSQTQERGLGSAAYRRDRDESVSDTVSMTGSMRLPGMSRESTVESERQATPASESIRSLSPSKGGSIRGGPLRPFKHSASASLSSSKSTRSPLPIMNSHIFEPPVPEPTSSGEKDPSSGIMPTSLSQGRISPERLERSPSPTKGLGGFVQSAMLKRSDSVSKRWSAQPGTGLSRGNSIASNRSGCEASRYGISSLTAPKDQAPTRSSREISPVASSRPGSAHSAMNLTRGGKENNGPGLSEVLEPSSAADAPTNTAAVLPSQQENRHSDLDPGKPNRDRTMSEPSPPSSPSKRWSPTKSSWLENAINKPDSPKPRMPPPRQPSWMTNLNQPKQQRGATDPGKSSNFKEVSTGGLLRSPPVGAINKPNSISSLASRPTAGTFELPRTKSFSSDSAPKEEKSRKPPTNTGTEAMPTARPDTAVATASSESTSAKAASGDTTPSKSVRNYTASEAGERKSESPQMPKPKPETPPKKDFRSNLKPRQVSGDRKPAEEAEFKNVFGKLKRTQTQNYVAPDELKDNILRGKAGLSLTGGPKKTERRDEFKESLLKQKEAMKTGSPPAVGRKPSIDTSAKHQRALGPLASATEKPSTTSDGIVRSPSSGVTLKEPQPEALARLQLLKEKSRPTTGPPPAALAKQKDAPVNGRKGLDFNSSLAGMLARGPSPLTARDQSAPMAISQPDDRTHLGPTTDEILQSPIEGPQLTHMTKARARGPKRRLPTSTDAKEENSSRVSLHDPGPTLTKTKSEPMAKIESPSTLKQDPQARPLTTISNNHRKPSQPQPPRKPSLNIDKPNHPNVTPASNRDSPLEPTTTQPKSLPTTKPKPLSPEIEQPRKPSTSVLSLSSTISDKPQEKTDRKLSDDAASSQDVEFPTEPRPQDTPPSVKGTAAKWTQNVPGERSSPARTRSPIKLPTRKDEEVAMQDAGLLPKQEAPLGLGIISSIQSPRTAFPSQHDLPTPPLNSPRSPPLPAKKPPSIASRVVSNSATSEPALKVEGSPIPQSSEAGKSICGAP